MEGRLAVVVLAGDDGDGRQVNGHGAVRGGTRIGIGEADFVHRAVAGVVAEVGDDAAEKEGHALVLCDQHGAWAAVAQFGGIDVQFYARAIGVEGEFHDEKRGGANAHWHGGREISVADAERPAAFSGYIALPIEVAELDLFTRAVVAPGQTAAVQPSKDRLVVVLVFAEQGAHPERRRPLGRRADAFVELADIGPERPVVLVLRRRPAVR